MRVADKAKLVREYQESDALLTQRITNKQFGFDTFDKIYQTYIDPNKWPYDVKLATPRGFTAIFNKTTRIIGGRFTGRIEPVEQDDEAGAKIASEHFRYSVERFNQFSDQPIEVKSAIWDTNTRLYGAGFMRTYWKTEYKKVGGKQVKVYDNWWVDVLNNRDVLLQPGRETMSNSEYVIVRRYMSLEELENIQEDGAGFDKLAMAELKQAKTGTGKDANYVPVVKQYKGHDWTDGRFEVCNTYYKNRFVTWCPKMGTSGRTKGQMQALVLREIANPYRHQTIPVVPLVYIPSEEDIYGMSELQPVTALLKILSALQSQYIELVNKNLYPPTLVSATETRIDTFKYRPKAFWLVNNPQMVQVLDTKAGNSRAEFSQVYQMIVTEFLDAMGETGTGVSQVDLLGSDKTATEIKDRAYLRGSRDNFNKMMLNASLKKLMYQLFEMLRDQKFVGKDTIVRIVGKDALKYFDQQGYSGWGINDQGYEMVYAVAQQLNETKELSDAANDNRQDMFELAYQALSQEGALDEFAEPLSPVMTGKGVIEKLATDESANTGYLHVNPETDYLGEFNFIPDVEALVTPSPEREYQARASWYEQAKETEQTGALQQEGYRLKHKDILTKMAELIRIKDAEQYFEKMEVQDEIVPAGGGGEAGLPGGQVVPGQQTVPGAPGAAVGQAGGGIPQTQQAGMGGALPLR